MGKNYLHVITNFEQIGGAEQMLIRTINASENSVMHTLVSLMSVSDLMRSQLPKNVVIYALNARGIVSLLLSIFKLRTIIKKYSSSIIYSWMYHANFVAALTKLFPSITNPLFWGVRHSLDDLAGEGVSTKMAIYAGRLLNKIPDGTIYCSRRAMKQHIDFGYSLKGTSIYIPNGYEFEKSKSRMFDKNHIVIGAVGRFHEAKDYYTLFKAVAPILSNNNSTKLRVAGREVDNANKVLQSYMREFSINPKQVELLGQINNMPEYYYSVDFFVLSSKTEGFPNVLAESSGYGCIAFSTDVGDASIILNDESRIVPIGNAQALEKLIVEYMNKPSEELSKTSGLASNFIRSTYSIDVISKKILSIGNEL